MNSTTLSARPAGQLRGFETLDDETVIDALPVGGTLPTWLDGSLYRNGPAKFEVGTEKYAHWFDGLGMIHRFTVSNGTVSYANRYLASPGFADAKAAGRIARGEFGTKARVGPLEQLRRLGRDTASHNANVNIVPCGDELFALTETPMPIAFDARTLETLGGRPYTDGLSAQVITAHPHYDRDRQRSINLATTFGRRSTYHVVSSPADGRSRDVVGSLTVDHPSYLHHFALTERYAIIVEFPFVLGNALDLMFGRRAFIENYQWMPQRGTRFHAMRLSDGAIAHSWQGDPFFAFHFINAYDDGDAIVIDVSAYDDAAIVADLRLDNVRSAEPQVASAAFRRYRLDPARSDATYETVTAFATELPRVAAVRQGKPYRYAYGISAMPDRHDTFANGLVKVDADTRGVKSWSEADQYPGEPVFVARPGATAEDDGAVLSVVLDGREGRSYLLVLDGADFTEIARANVPHHMPFGFHGIFVRA